jgi:hypothetical protein
MSRPEGLAALYSMIRSCRCSRLTLKLDPASSCKEINIINKNLDEYEQTFKMM